MPVVRVRKDVMRRDRITVESEGDLVVMNFGSTRVTLKYETALKFAQWVRLRAKQSKSRAGDTSRHWSSLGILTDAETGREFINR